MHHTVQEEDVEGQKRGVSSGNIGGGDGGTGGKTTERNIWIEIVIRTGE